MVCKSVRLSVRRSVCYHVFCHYAQQGGQKAIPTGSVPHWLDFKNGDFRKSTAFKSYGVKTKRTSQYANEHGLPRPDSARFEHAVEGVEITRRASMWSWFGKNTTYRRSYIACVFTVFEKPVARICTACVFLVYAHVCVNCTPTNLCMRNAAYWCRGDYTHTNNAGYSNGSSLPVEGLEINDV